MNDFSYTKLFVQTVKKKIIFILLLGILAGIAIAGGKVLFSDIATRHGDYYFIRTVQVSSPDNQGEDNFDYKGFLESPGNYYQFVRKVEQGDFDFHKIDSAWKRKSSTEQLDWLKQNMQVTSFRNGVFQVSIHFDANATREVDYMKEHGVLLADDFMQVSEQSIQKVKPDATFKLVGKEETYPVVEPINRKSMLIKFGIIGFVVGIFGGTVIFYLWALRKQYGRMQQ